MKTTRTNKSLLTLILSVAFIFSINAKIYADFDSINNTLSSEQYQLEKIIFTNFEDSNCQLDINDVEIIEIDETVDINFDTTTHLPEDFNALKGMHDLDWSTIELVELEENVDLGFDTQAYLPKDFNALKGKHDLDWSSIELIELEEDVDLGFDTKAYLPEGFNPYDGINTEKEIIVSLN